MPVLYKRNSISTIGGSGGESVEPPLVPGKPQQQPGLGFGRQAGAKRTPEPSETEKVLASKSQAQGIRLSEKKRQQDFHRKIEAVRMIQRAWRRYQTNRRWTRTEILLESYTKETVHRKRLRATQEEWERQIAALTIQLAWRKFYRKKLLRALHPNRRQLMMWDPEIVALKQQALVNYIYNEQIQAPFWHPILRAPVRPLWMRFIPSAAAVSYNFAVDQYVPWVARLRAQPPFPEIDSPGSSGSWSGSQNGPKGDHKGSQPEQNSKNLPNGYIRQRTSITSRNSSLSSASMRKKS